MTSPSPLSSEVVAGSQRTKPEEQTNLKTTKVLKTFVVFFKT